MPDTGPPGNTDSASVIEPTTTGHINPANKYLKIVILANARIQRQYWMPDQSLSWTPIRDPA